MSIESLKFILIALLLVFLTQIMISNAHAQEEVCIAVYPCLESGEIDPRFNVEGFCGDKFRAQCAAVKASLVTDELVSCQKDKDTHLSQLALLEKEIIKLKKQLKIAKKKK